MTSHSYKCFFGHSTQCNAYFNQRPLNRKVYSDSISSIQATACTVYLRYDKKQMEQFTYSFILCHLKFHK